ncbi:MAG: thioester reductase domain-containing protein [Methylococcaceae bacterium]|nr:thioester reductase domain-containing protein [Methylococcaceae bacterium]
MADWDDLRKDAELDAAIEFPHALAARWEAPERIFLTGATGFLGAYLLDELLRNTRATIYCLIRSPSAGLGRLARHLEAYGLWREGFAERLVPVMGDLAQPRFGLESAQFETLAETIDVIYHNAAQVNALYPYERLRATNVVGTQEILRFAGLKQTKPVHFMSTVAVFFHPGNRGRLILETDTPEGAEDFKGGYRQSKWVAESLVCGAGSRGLPVVTYRLGRIFGHSRTGFHGHGDEDALCRVLKGCILIGHQPQVDTRINLLAVDEVSRAIVHLSRQKSSYGQVFHLCHPRSVAWESLLDVVREFGYPLSKLPYPAWMAELKHRAAGHKERQFLSALHLLLRTPLYLFADKPEFDARNTHDALAGAALPWTSIEAVLSVSLSHFQRCGYLPPVPEHQP